MNAHPQAITNPELFIGLVCPIGVDLDRIVKIIETEIKILGYRTEYIKLTDLMKSINIGMEIDESSYDKKYFSLIYYADKLREIAESNYVMASLAIKEIRSRRESFYEELGEKPLKPQDTPVNGTAYIIRQFKRPEEIEMMRRTYGRKFVQMSIYLGKEDRKQVLMNKIRSHRGDAPDKADCEMRALELIRVDTHEKSDPYGQRVEEVFHLGDAFVHSKTDAASEASIKRFLNAFFGSNGVSPTKMEYGMYSAKAASLRSIDLSRQVGAAIFTSDGEKVVSGCNEVPKAFGGTYWENDEPKFRDFELGRDANHGKKVEILYDFMERLSGEGVINKEFVGQGDTKHQVETLLQKESVKNSQLMDIIEFGRMIHAEMSAITDAARLGVSIKNGILYCTTFPCHICAKHIVAAGIQEVVFLEPYPKSYAEELHSDSITFSDHEKKDKVLFRPFIGISPRRYRDIFEKTKRKNTDGTKRDWFEGQPVPMIEDRGPAYIDNEALNLLLGLKKFMRIDDN